MKLKILLFLSLAVLYFACQKHNDFFTRPSFQSGFVDSAVDYLQSQVSIKDFQDVDLENPQIFKEGSNTVAVSFALKNETTRSIIIGKDTAQRFLGNWIVNAKMGSERDGILKTESFNGKEKSEVTYVNGLVVKLVRSNDGKISTSKFSYSTKNSLYPEGRVSYNVEMGLEGDGEEHWLPDVVVTGYINNSQTHYYSWYWAFNQNPVYINTYSTTAPSNGGGGTAFTIDAELNNEPNTSISQMFNCFGNVSSTGATYTVMLCADVPINGSPTSSANVFGSSAGHTFLTVTKQNGSSKVTRSFGFYPGSNVSTPVSVPSIMKDDYGHEYNASITMTINATQFVQLQQKATAYSSNQYNVCTYNCTSYALGIFNSLRTNPVAVSPITVYLPIAMPPQYPTAGAIQINNSPQMLFAALRNMKNGAGSESGNIKIDQSGNAHAPLDHGGCN
jgi:hypothetical protein